MTQAEFPTFDARAESALSAPLAHAFRERGILVIRNLLAPAELEALQRQTLPLVERAAAERLWDIDYQYKPNPVTGGEVPFRVEYVIDKVPACRALLGHPAVLRCVESLQGSDFIPTWDSMVFKLAGAGAAIEWHRDADTGQCDGQWPIFNVDIYLDGSDATNCLWGIAGSNHWSDLEAARVCATLNDGGFRTEGATPILLRAGDALLHDILVLHGSPPATSDLRRVVYYEFRPADVEVRLGPHTPEYVPLKQRVLEACLRDRAATSYAAGEVPFVYRPTRWCASAPLAPEDRLATYRIPHHEYWRVVPELATDGS